MQNRFWAGAAGVAVLVVFGAPAHPASLTERLAPCLACHGEKGTSGMPEVPSLGGQPAPYMLVQLFAFREKQRIAPPMNDLAKDLTNDDLTAFSEALAKLPPPATPAKGADAAKIEKGRAAAQKHRCAYCHNPDMSGHDQIGRIAGQREDYLLKALRAYKAGTRAGFDPAMIEVVREMSDEDIVGVAHLLAHWK